MNKYTVFASVAAGWRQGGSGARGVSRGFVSLTRAPPFPPPQPPAVDEDFASKRYDRRRAVSGVVCNRFVVVVNMTGVCLGLSEGSPDEISKKK